MSSSPRVRLEVAFLDDQNAPAPFPPAARDERTCRTLLVVAAEVDLRRYVRECLRERTDLRLLEAATVTEGLTFAAHQSPEILIVDEPERDILTTLSQLCAIVIVDDVPHVPHGAPGVGARHRLLARPFTAERFVAEIGQLLG